MPEEIKNCPCCNGKGHRVEMSIMQYEDAVKIECMSCKLATPIFYYDFSSGGFQLALDIWNRRS